MNASRFLAAIAALAAVQAAAAPAIYRCKSDGGAVTYQEIPCASADGGVTDIPANFPEINHVERNRLLQREAALEERLLKRAQIDSAERIARDDRLARERENQALREALAQRDAQLATGPAFVVVGPSRARAPHYRRPFQRL